MLLSVVVPCYNEAVILGETHARLVECLEPLGSFEVIYVDDGSEDGTLGQLRLLSGNDGRVRVVRLSRNFGQQIATSAGLEDARGAAVIVIDADLQDPPEVIPRMVALWREGWEVVFGQRIARAGDGWWQQASAKIFYRALRQFFPPLPLDAGDFRLLDRVVVDAVLRMPERDRFLRGMVSWAGFRQIAVPFRRAARSGGKPGYSFRKSSRLAADAFFSFVPNLLRAALWVGLGAIGFALAMAGAGLVEWFVSHGRGMTALASFMAALLFLGGVQLVTLGLVGEYLGRILGEVKRRPLYFVSERFGFPNSEKPSGGAPERTDPE